MVIFFVLFAVLATAIGWLVALIYERRQDVLYGRYLPPEIRKTARNQSRYMD